MIRFCHLCFKIFFAWKPYRLHINTKDGMVKKPICKDCAKIIDYLKDFKYNDPV